MSKENEQHQRLLEDYQSASITEEERDILMTAVASGQADDALETALDEAWRKIEPASGDDGKALPFEKSEVYKLLHSETTIKTEEPVDSAGQRNTSGRWYWVAAASVIGLLLAGGWLLGWFANSRDPLTDIPDTYLSKTNKDTAPREIVLSDGTVVRLLPGASIHYPPAFSKAAREVYLTGDAFFDVSHQQGKRFVVHGLDLSAEVLGTSFWVRQDAATGASQIEVRSGKVQVTANHTQKEANKSHDGVLVLPNHKVSYMRNAGDLQLLLADSLLPDPKLLMAKEEVNGSSFLKFENPTRLEIILKELSDLYGIAITVSTPDLNNCLVTGDLSRQDLSGKLDVICLSVSAEHVQNGKDIVIKGQGCPQ